MNVAYRSPPLRSGYCLGRVPENGEEMTDGSGDHKQMPGEMCVPDSMRGKEADAGSVSYPAREQPCKTGQRDPLQNLRRGNYNQPAHHQIEND